MMASSLNTGKGENNEEENLNLGQFLTERQNPDPSRDKIIQNSHEKHRRNRQNSADASNLSRSQKERKLDDFLRNKRRRRGRKKLTVSDVKAEAAKILEEFLQEQLAQQSIQTSSPEYQRIVEASIFETTTPSGESSNYLASSSNILREDSIPYADESDNELRKAESLPHENFVELKGFHGREVPTGLQIHHGKSKSAPYTHPDTEWRESPSKRLPGTVQPTPPPPPGTPHTPSENSSNGSGPLLHPVPYTGKPTDSSIPCSSDSLDISNSLGKQHSRSKNSIPEEAQLSLNLLNHSESHSRSTTSITDNAASSESPTKHSYTKLMSRVKKSGSVSSSDTDSSNQHSHGRKKKSMFKKAQHRMQNFFRNKKYKGHDGDDEMDIYDDDSPRGNLNEKRAKPKKPHKKHKGKSDIVDEADMADSYEPGDNQNVLEERHVHKHKHIHQTHSGGDRKTVLRSEESEETVDIVDSKEKKHIEKKWKMKESSGHDTGILGRLRRLTLRDKGKKQTMKESKSDQFGKDEADSRSESSNYSRAISVPGSAQSYRPTQLGLDETDDAGLKMYPNGRGFAFSNFESEQKHPGMKFTRAMQGQSSELVVNREERDEKDMKRRSSHLDIVDYRGNIIDRLYFDEGGNELPKNKSFHYLREEDIRERVIDDHGHRRVVRDVEHHEHMEMAESDGEDRKGLKDLTEAEKDDLYGKIASRLQCIGDNFMSEREDHSRSASASPGSKLTDDQKSSPEQEFTKSTLTPLEIELRDELRKVADDLDDKLEANAKKAALHVSGLVTYNHFKNIVQESVGKEEGWEQVAAVFQITKRAMRLAGQSGAMALQIKEMSLKYIEDTFANWIVGQGGWESMLSDAESETESELD